MESPSETYIAMKRITGIEEVAYNRLLENYLQLDLKGPKKLIDIESTDQESVLKKIGGGRPFEGMIYTFIHLNEKNLAELQNLKTGKPIQFHDFTPIVFCTFFNPLTGLLRGLNLNMLPETERLKFFQAYWEFYKEFFKRVEEKTEYNKEAINKKYRLAAWVGQNPMLFKHFNQTQNALFEFAYRSYYLNKVAIFRMIEYEEWKYIPFFDAKQSFRRVNMDQIYQVYWDNKNKSR